MAARTWRYAGLDELEGRPHVVVDGAARAGTTLVLSHWPMSPTPAHLARDLSAEIARAFLSDDLAATEPSGLVTNDHPDLDGLVSLFFLTAPPRALEHADLLLEVARVGDFGVVRSLEAARTAWALETLMRDPHLATVDLVDAAINEQSTLTRTYRSLLAVLPRYLEDHDRFRYLFAHREERFLASRELLALRSTSAEDPSLDLAIFEIDSQEMDDGDESSPTLGVDALAIHSATDASRILIGRAGHIAYYDRYETWVRYVTRRRLARRDLQPLAVALSAVDRVPWKADPPAAIEPVLRTEGKSSLSFSEAVERISAYLAQSPVAFDPFAGPRSPFAAG